MLSFNNKGTVSRVLLPWDSPGKSTGVGCHFLLQGIEPGSPAFQADALTSELPGKPWVGTIKKCPLCDKVIDLLKLVPGGSEVKESASNAGDLGSIPWRRKWQLIQVFLLGESHGWRSLVGYSPRGRKESHTTERLHLTYGELCSHKRS